MAKRDFSVKYSQSFLGPAWIILQPITGMLIFTFFFTYVFPIDQRILDIPYHLFCFSGYMSWLLFANIVNGAGISLMAEENLIKKVYFPRIIVPLSKSLTYFFDFLVSFVVLILIAVFFDLAVLYRFILTIPAILLLFTHGFTIALWLSALTIRYRDLIHIIPYLINFGIWLTPVFFPMSLLPDKVKFLVKLNPLTFPIELFRSLLFSNTMPEFSYFVVITQLGFFILLYVGLRYFIKIDKLLSDYL